MKRLHKYIDSSSTHSVQLVIHHLLRLWRNMYFPSGGYIFYCLNYPIQWGKTWKYYVKLQRMHVKYWALISRESSPIQWNKIDSDTRPKSSWIKETHGNQRFFLRTTRAANIRPLKGTFTFVMTSTPSLELDGSVMCHVRNQEWCIQGFDAYTWGNKTT